MIWVNQQNGRFERLLVFAFLAFLVGGKPPLACR